jgi:hypothetical protein
MRRDGIWRWGLWSRVTGRGVMRSREAGLWMMMRGKGGEEMGPH